MYKRRQPLNYYSKQTLICLSRTQRGLLMHELNGGCHKYTSVSDATRAYTLIAKINIPRKPLALWCIYIFLYMYI